MARLASIEKAGYFPCSSSVVEALVQHHIRLYPWAVAPTYILDPCAGEGSAVRTFARALANAQANQHSSYINDMLHDCRQRIHVRAVEIDAERASAAKALLGAQNVLHSAIENVSAVGKFNVMWLNPPYDQVSSGRAELAWVRMCAPFVGDNGTLVLIVPDMFVGGGRYAKEMEYALSAAGFGSALVLRFPDPEYQPFKQVAIIVSRPVSDYGRYSSYPYVDLRVAGTIGECDHTHTHIIRAYNTTPSLARATQALGRESVFEPDAGSPVPATLCDLIGDPSGSTSALRPLAPMRSEHAAMVAAAGMFNGAVVGGKAIKGSTIKRLVKTTNQSTTDNGTEVTEVVEAEVLAAQLSTIDLHTGAIAVVNSVDDKAQFERLLEAHAQEFVDLAKRLYPPVFAETELARYEPGLARVHAPRALAGHENGLFPPQTFRAGAILDCWRRHKVATLVGEMGTGKTIVAIAAATNKALQRKAHNQKVVVLLPPKEDLVKKWAEEIRTALRDCHPYVVHAQTISDVQNAFARDGLVFILLKETTAKMSSGWAPVQPIRRWRLKNNEPRPAICPVCGRPILYDVDDPAKLKAHCRHCGSPMWTAIRRTNGNGNSKAAHAGYQAFEQRIVDAKANYPGTIQTTEEVTRTRLVLRNDLKSGEELTPDDWNILSRAKDWYEETVTGVVTKSALRWVSALQPAENVGYARHPLARFIRDRYRDRYVLIMDECFPGDTPVLTERGPIPIQDIQVGCKVLSEKNGRLVYAQVSRVLRKPKTQRMVCVTHEHGSFICTENHKIYTNDGLIKAGCLDSSYLLHIVFGPGIIERKFERRIYATTITTASDMYYVWEAVQQQQKAKTAVLLHLLRTEGQIWREKKDATQNQGDNEVRTWYVPSLWCHISQEPQEPPQNLLLQIMFNEGALGIRHTRSCVQASQDTCPDRRFAQDGAPEQLGPGSTSQNGRCDQGARICSTRGKWPDIEMASDAGSRAWTWVADGILRSNWQTRMAQSSDRYCPPGDKNCCRSQWEQSPLAQATRARCDQTTNAGSQGLASDHSLELAGSSRCTGLSRVHSVEYVDIPDEYVYDLTVEDTHCFFAAGVLVSNCHNLKASDSARSYAAQDLLASAHRAIQMTGTIYNGLASSIYYLLWRALPDFRAVWGWNDVQRFINQYGLFETITRTYRDPSSTSASGYTNFTERKSERPGIHPAMIALLLPSTVFFGIRDLDVILPPYAEHTLFVDRPDALGAVENYLDSIKHDAVARMMDGDYSLMAQFNWARLGAWDMASQGDAVDGHRLDPLNCPGETWPKEEALLRLIAREKRAGRKVLCFVGQINRRDVTPRLCTLLERYGMRGAVMRADEKHRVEFIRRALKDGVDVIFTSAQLVKEGIDLLELPTIVWFVPEYNIYLVQQANRRSWRIGQTEPVHVYYIAYDRTPQASAMYRIAKKLGAAQTLQGDVRQGLAALLGEEDFVSRLQEATISTEHFESDLSLDDLPALVPFPAAAAPQSLAQACPGMDVQVTVRSSLPARVRVTVQVDDLGQFQQLSLF